MDSALVGPIVLEAVDVHVFLLRGGSTAVVFEDGSVRKMKGRVDFESQFLGAYCEAVVPGQLDGVPILGIESCGDLTPVALLGTATAPHVDLEFPPPRGGCESW